jgi:hypothetical protein
MYGPTIIAVEGAHLASRLFESWAQLFALGPPILALTGNFGWATDAAPTPDATQVTLLEGAYEQLQFDRDEVVGVLLQLAVYAESVASGRGKLYLLHQGV